MTVLKYIATLSKVSCGSIKDTLQHCQKYHMTVLKIHCNIVNSIIWQYGNIVKSIIWQYQRHMVTLSKVSHRKEMSLPHTPAADLPQICSRPAADSHLFHMQISFAADLPQTCRILFQYDEESAAGLPQTCRRLAAYSFSMMKSLRQVCRRLAADLPHTLSV